MCPQAFSRLTIENSFAPLSNIQIRQIQGLTFSLNLIPYLVGMKTLRAWLVMMKIALIKSYIKKTSLEEKKNIIFLNN
jgi:hypothetical protein